MEEAIPEPKRKRRSLEEIRAWHEAELLKLAEKRKIAARTRLETAVDAIRAFPDHEKNQNLVTALKALEAVITSLK